MVALAVVYSAIATQERRVEDYGKDVAEKEVEERKTDVNEKEEGMRGKKGRWNGRTILTLGEGYTELEEEYSRFRPRWMGEENMRLTRLQQAATDFRTLA